MDTIFGERHGMRFEIMAAIKSNPNITANELMEVIKKYDQDRMPKTERAIRNYKRELTKVLQGGGQRWCTKTPHIAMVAHAVRHHVMVNSVMQAEQV